MNRVRTLLGIAVMLVAAPVMAEVDLSGMWMVGMQRFNEDFLERGEGPAMVEYQGLPINESARARALSWDPSILTLEEYQCRPHPIDYGPRHSNFRIWKEMDPKSQEVTAWRSRRSWQAVERYMYMDNGRVERPSENAAHTWQGFSLAHWEGDVLAIETTHIKQSYLRRNGVPRSDKATVREHIIRHGDRMTFVTVVNDPVNLTEPMIRSSDYQLDLSQSPTPYPCDSVVEVAGRSTGYVPHILPGQNTFMHEFAERYGLSMDAVLGGAKTMYPDYFESGAALAVRK